MERLVLGRDGLFLLGVLLSQSGYIRIQIGHLLVELCDMDILTVELLAEGCQLLVLLFHLLRQVIDDLLELSAFHGALAYLLLQFVDQFLVLLHHRLDELEVLLDAL